MLGYKHHAIGHIDQYGYDMIFWNDPAHVGAIYCDFSAVVWC